MGENLSELNIILKERREKIESLEAEVKNLNAEIDSFRRRMHADSNAIRQIKNLAQVFFTKISDEPDKVRELNQQFEKKFEAIMYKATSRG